MATAIASAISPAATRPRTTQQSRPGSRARAFRGLFPGLLSHPFKESRTIDDGALVRPFGHQFPFVVGLNTEAQPALINLEQLGAGGNTHSNRCRRQMAHIHSRPD